MRPKYRVPSMAEIAPIPWNGFSVVSTFSGGGGSSLGYRMAGFRIAWVSEFIEAARKTYAANAAPYTIIDDRDIRDVAPEEILKATGFKRGDVDVLDGSPPCSSFSRAGKRDEKWGEDRNYSGKKQRTDNLFVEYARILKGLQPKVFVAENVPDMMEGRAKGFFIDAMVMLKDCGYRVKASIIDAQWLGVPQARRRLIFIGVRNDLKLDPVFPKPLRHRFGLKEAISDLDEKVEPETDVSRFAIGKESQRLAPGVWSDRYEGLIVSEWHRPALTITASGGKPSTACALHPDRRKFSIAEVKRLCSFPDDFILTGNFTQQWERLGRAVPPRMMHAVAEVVRDKILRNVEDGKGRSSWSAAAVRRA